MFGNLDRMHKFFKQILLPTTDKRIKEIEQSKIRSIFKIKFIKIIVQLSHKHEV